jgi:hypothetical protein
MPLAWRRQIPFNGSGVFTRNQNWQNDAANAIDISAPEMDNEDNNFASGPRYTPWQRAQAERLIEQSYLV